jgi:mono/diheme cytochrome c family protein
MDQTAVRKPFRNHRKTILRQKTKSMKLKFALLTAVFLTATILYATPPVEEGKSIFQARCAACHNVNKTLTGPALAGVDQRRSIDWIVNFVHSSQAMVKAGDKDAVALFNQFNKIPMPDHTDLSETQIKNVVEYIKLEATTAQKDAVEKKPAATVTKTYLPITFKNYGYMISFLGAFALLIGVIIFAVKVNRYKKAYFRQKQLQ